MGWFPARARRGCPGGALLLCDRAPARGYSNHDSARPPSVPTGFLGPVSQRPYRCPFRGQDGSWRPRGGEGPLSWALQGSRHERVF